MATSSLTILSFRCKEPMGSIQTSEQSMPVSFVYLGKKIVSFHTSVHILRRVSSNSAVDREFMSSRAGEVKLSVRANYDDEMVASCQFAVQLTVVTTTEQVVKDRNHAQCGKLRCSRTKHRDEDRYKEDNRWGHIPV